MRLLPVARTFEIAFDGSPSDLLRALQHGMDKAYRTRPEGKSVVVRERQGCLRILMSYSAFRRELVATVDETAPPETRLRIRFRFVFWVRAWLLLLTLIPIVAVAASIVQAVLLLPTGWQVPRTLATAAIAAAFCAAFEALVWGVARLCERAERTTEDQMLLAVRHAVSNWNRSLERS